MTSRDQFRDRQRLDAQTSEAQLILKNVALSATAEGVTISDATAPDNPLIYANSGFVRLTGYPLEEVLGRNCRFLQGPRTNPETVRELRAAIANGEQSTVQLLNYRKDGTRFWNRLSVTPVRNEIGRLTHYIGIQSDVTEQKNAEDELRKAKEALEEANSRMQSDLAAAARVQRALLPRSLPESDRVRLAWTFRPCTELAGDILNAFWLDERHLALYILDVSGHGVAAALLAVTVSRMLSPIRGPSCLFIRDPADPSRHLIAEPEQVARTLNRYFPLDERTNQYFTLIYGILNLESLEFRYVSAGHPPPIHIREAGQFAELQVTGPPIGMLPDASHEAGRVRLEPGDRLYCYTDGVSDSENARGQAFGQDRLRRGLIERSGEPLDRTVQLLMDDVEDWRQERRLEDDASVLALQLL